MADTPQSGGSGRLRGQISLVTGAGRGIGRAIALRLAAEGSAVAVCDFADQEAAETAEQVRTLGVETHWAGFDIQDSARCRSFVAEVNAKLGGLTILVNNAAIMPTQPVETLQEAMIDQVLAVNLKAAIVLSQAVIAPMRSAGKGVILHMSSAQGYIGSPKLGVYAATKAALRILAQSQAKELAVDGIRVNSVSPGTVDSPMFHEAAAAYPEGPAEFRRLADQCHPRGQIATMDEVAAVFAFLASEDAANITATDIRCDGGLVAAG